MSALAADEANCVIRMAHDNFNNEKGAAHDCAHMTLARFPASLSLSLPRFPVSPSLPLSLPPAPSLRVHHTHTRPHTHTHTHTHTHNTHMHILACTHACTHTHKCTYSRVRTRAHACMARMHACIQASQAEFCRDLDLQLTQTTNLVGIFDLKTRCCAHGDLFSLLWKGQLYVDLGSQCVSGHRSQSGRHQVGWQGHVQEVWIQQPTAYVPK